MVQTQFNKTVKMIRSDNETEFFNNECKALFEKLGVIRESSCPHTPQQNGVVERKHRHILEVARALRFQGSLPIRFWGECVLAAVYLINRMPTSVVNGQSPFEIFHGMHPDLSHLRTIGCLCYATKLVKDDIFSTRADAYVFMGYSSTKKGYVVYNLSHQKMLVSRDVVFKEDIFPFATKKMDKDVPLFNHQHITTDSQSVEDVITVQELVVNDDTLEFT